MNYLLSYIYDWNEEVELSDDADDMIDISLSLSKDDISGELSLFKLYVVSLCIRYIDWWSN